MNWDQRRNPIQPLVEWAAPALLASAVGWAVWTFDGSLLVAGLTLVTVFVLGAGLLRAVALEAGPVIAKFEAVPFDTADCSELLLDDPLVPIEQGSRVVRLFDRQPSTPGEMIARINDFLEVAPQVPARVGEVERRHRPSDASAALHEALASIRASLR